MARLSRSSQARAVPKGRTTPREVRMQSISCFLFVLLSVRLWPHRRVGVGRMSTLLPLFSLVCERLVTSMFVKLKYFTFTESALLPSTCLS